MVAFQVFQDLRLSCHFQKCSQFFSFGGIFDLKQFNKHKLRCPPKWGLLGLYNYSSLSSIVLALSPAVTNLPNKTLIFHDSQGPTIKFQDFPGLENKILKFHDFPGFPWPVRTLKNIIIEAFDSISINPLSPNIHIQILQTDLHTFPLRISWENLIKDQGIFSLVIILLISTTLSLDNVWIL